MLERWLDEYLFVCERSSPGAVCFAEGDVFRDVAQTVVRAPHAVGGAQSYGCHFVGVKVAGTNHVFAQFDRVGGGCGEFELARGFVEPFGTIEGRRFGASKADWGR